METPGPLSICLTNMVIVFGVLIFLACVIQLIHIVDPTKGKTKSELDYLRVNQGIGNSSLVQGSRFK